MRLIKDIDSKSKEI